MGADLARALEDAGRLRPDKPVLLPHRGGPDGAADGAIDWQRFDRLAGGVAEALAAGGSAGGSRVALDLDDPVETVIALFGALKAGAAVLPLNPRLTAAERTRILADFDPDRTVEAIDRAEADFPALGARPGDAGIVLYTSGSTGAPKGVVLSQAALAFALDSWRGPVMDLSEDDVSLSALPLAHSLGIFGSVLAPLLSGAAVVFLPRFAPEDALAAIARRRVSVFPGVATMFRRILDSPTLPHADLSSLRYALSGAAPCPWELASRWREATGVRIVRGYGMTELFRPISYRAADPTDLPDAIGRAVPGVDLRVVDDGGAALAAGETGELWIRSPARMTCYLGRPGDTEAVLAGEWFRTGDLATLSPDGHVRIVGRKKDMILRGGYTVAPGEVEAVLMSHPAVAEAAVIGVPDDELGEEIAAFVSLKQPGTAAAEDIIAYCRGRLAGYKYPRRIRIEPALPKGPAGKVQKARLRF